MDFVVSNVLVPEAAHSEARSGILAKKYPGDDLCSHLGAIWTHFKAFLISIAQNGNKKWVMEKRVKNGRLRPHVGRAPARRATVTGHLVASDDSRPRAVYFAPSLDDNRDYDEGAMFTAKIYGLYPGKKK